LQHTINVITTISNATLLDTITTPSLNDAYVSQATGDIWVYTNASTLSLGMSVSSGQQNQGFFNARTLMLANKPFLQSQVVSFIDKVFNNNNLFSYDTTKCSRDTGLIVDALAFDLLYPTATDSQSTFAGLQYWNHTGYTSGIAAELTTTTNAINYLKTQVAALISSNATDANFNLIVDILTNGTDQVTDKIVPNGATSTTGTVVTAYNTIISAKDTLATAVINYINTNNVGFVYDQTTCRRDVGYILDSIAFDLLHGGNRQSIQSAVYYFNFTGTTAIKDEIPQTTAAYNYIKRISRKIIKGQTVQKSTGNTANQITNLPLATDVEADAIGLKVDYIVSIIKNGPTVANDKAPINLTATTSTNIVRAFNLLEANRTFIRQEVVAYINQTYSTPFTYNTATCNRDVGLVVDVIGMDLLHGSDSDSTFSGLQYWSQDLGFTGETQPESTATIQAISHLRTLALAYVSGGNQSKVTNLFTIINGILTNGPAGVTDTIDVGEFPTTDTALLSDITALQTNISVMQDATFTWIRTNYPSLTYSTSTCRRDVGQIINSICFDLKHNGNLQSIKSGVYYYAYDSDLTAIPNEIPQTTAAYSYIQKLIPSIVTGQLIPATYQTAIKQNISGFAATDAEAIELQSKINVITSIIVGGPTIADAKTLQNLTISENTYATNAWNLLQSNRSFIQAEVAAFIANTFNGKFDYNRELSYRDTGILVENVAYDAAFGGNEKSVESGKAYWNGVVSYIATTMPQCIASINYLNSLIQDIIVNNPCPVLPPVANIPFTEQVINTALVNGEIARPNIDNLFGIITNIIEAGTDSAPEVYKSPGPDASYVSAEILLQANRKFIQENTLNYINWNLIYTTSTTYVPFNQIKCSRDTGIIVDSIATDLLFPTSQYSQSTFAGLQYFNQAGYTGNIASEITTTTAAISYLKQLATKVIKNVTASSDLLLGIVRYGTETVQNLQVTNIQPGTSSDVTKINEEFDIILSIMKGNTTGWTDRVVPNKGIASALLNVQQTYDLLIANKPYLQQEVYSYITSPTGLNYSSFTTSTCIRDIGYIIDSVAFDVLYDGNRQAIQSGLSYYQQSSVDTVIPKETTATISAFNYLGSMISTLVISTNYVPLQAKVKPVLGLATATSVPSRIATAISSLTNILANGPTGFEFTPISLISDTSTNTINAYNIIESNKDFLVAEVNAWLVNTYNSDVFQYDQALCYRDAGLMVDAVSQDILLGGNQKSIEAGLAYWNQGYNYVSKQITTTTAAIAYISSIAQKIIANTTVTSVTGTVSKQVINPFFQYGDKYMPQQAVARNFGIISTIISEGKEAAPPVYAGSGLQALTGMNGLDVKISPTVVSINTNSTGKYVIGLSQPTVGFGNNTTLYFGNTQVFPLQDNEVDALSLKQTGNTNRWDERKVDAIGGMGGSLVDGAVVSDRSPIQSFVYDAFTQLTQGGVGVKVTNNGYAQLVSVFTIFGSVGVQVDNGGIASIVNSNANFGDICLLAKGYGTRKFSGTIFNPANRAYPFSPGLEGLDQYYPAGYWPYRGTIDVFVPDLANRPHISLVMEIEPPKAYSNGYNSDSLKKLGIVFEGFLNAQPSTGTLVAGTINLTNISTQNVYVGNNVYVIDQFGYPYDNFPYLHDEFGNYVDINGKLATTATSYVPNPYYKIRYCQPGTLVKDVNYNSISLSTALTSGASFPTNVNYFTIYFTGNSYYTVMTSSPANNPYLPNSNILSANTDPNYNGPDRSQIAAHVAAMKYLNTITNKVITNNPVHRTVGNKSKQYINNTLGGGAGSTTFVDLGFRNLTNIVNAPSINAALSVMPSGAISQKGTISSGAGSAATLIESNIDFLSDEVVAFVNSNYPSIFNTSNLCQRDTGYIVDAINSDLLYGSTSDSTFTGLQYWSQDSGFTGQIPSESTATIGAIAYLGSVVKSFVSSGNTATVQTLFDKINDILVNSPFGVTDTIDFGGFPTTNAQTLNDVAILQANKNNIQTTIINYITATYPFTTYDETTCRRDVGYIIDSICSDLSSGGNIQSVKSGVYYYSYASSSTVIANETTATVAAYNYIRDVIIPNVVQGLTNWSPVQTTVKQVTTGYAAATSTESDTLKNNIDAITNIIVNGPGVAPAKTPQSLTASVNANIIKAWRILHANREFIQAEVVAYVNKNYSSIYNTFGMSDGQELKCRRDVALTLRQMIYDLETGGNYNMIYAGLSYWSRPGTYHVVELGEAVTDPSLFPDGSIVNFYQRSYISASGYVFEYVGAGSNYGALPQVGRADPIQGRETVQLDSGKVFFTSTDQNGDFRIGPELVISQATGVISGRVFTQSLFANMTPFILAIEAL
jgi:hypothetical protein